MLSGIFTKENYFAIKDRKKKFAKCSTISINDIKTANFPVSCLQNNFMEKKLHLKLPHCFCDSINQLMNFRGFDFQGFNLFLNSFG